MPKSKHRKKPGRGPHAMGGAATAGSESEVVAEAQEVVKRPRVSPMQFIRQVRDEAQKITWTSRQETMVSTVMVLVMVAVASIFFLLVDQLLRMVIPFILNLGA